MHIDSKRILESLIIVGLMYCQIGNSQIDIGLATDFGLSDAFYDFSTGGEQINSKKGLSFNSGFYIDYSVGKSSQIGVDILYSHIQGSETSIVNTVDDINSAVPIVIEKEIEVLQKLSYLSVPIRYTYRINNLQLSFGPQTSFLIAHKRILTKKNLDDNSVETSVINDKYAKNIDLGLKACIIYDLTPNLAITANYYHGLTNYFPKGARQKAKILQLTVGIRYRFLKTEK